jgi:hypothetical protein
MALFFWTGWLVWAILLGVSGMRHPVVAERPGVLGVRRLLAAFGLLMLILTLTPVPVTATPDVHSSLLDFLRALLDAFRQWRSGQ